MGDSHGHRHGVSPRADRRWLAGALVLIATYLIAEVVVGLAIGSIALLSDAAHMLTDVSAVALALVASRLAQRPPRGSYTYGLKRAEILSAQANGITLLLLALWLAYEAVRRLLVPVPVVGGALLVTALVGVVVNLIATALLSRAERRSLNVEGAYQHVLTDLFAFVATAIAGVVIMLTGFDRADAIASLLVVALMVRSGLGLVRSSGRVLLEAAPAGMDTAAIGRSMAALPDVVEVHDLHVWEITSQAPALSAHVIVEPSADCHALRMALEELLRTEFDLTHTTLQVDHAAPELHTISRGG